MDLIKKLTGKNPADYEPVAKALVDNSDIELFKKLVKQDDFLFDFIKDNVAKRIQNACNQDNYLNLMNFFGCYSPSYDTMIARVLYSFSGDALLPEMKEVFLNGNNEEKAYAVKYFSFVKKDLLEEMIPLLRKTAYSDFEPLSYNSIEVLSLLKDEESKNAALKRLDSEDEFEQFEAVKFLAVYQAKDSVKKILGVMKKSSLSENIAAEIPYLVPLEELVDEDEEGAILTLCYIVNALPEIINLTAVVDYDLLSVFEKILLRPLNSYSAVLLRLAKDKFGELISNDEYLYDCDKNTKEQVYSLNRMLQSISNNELDSLLYEELYDGSDFVSFAIDYVDELAELESLLDSKNPTIVLKTLTLLKEKGLLNEYHKDTALNSIEKENLKDIIRTL